MRTWVRNFSRSLSQIDLYGQKVQLLQKKQENHSTMLGLLASIGIAVFTLFSLISLTQDMFSLSNPNIVSKVVSNIDPERYEINPEDFIFAIAIGDYKGIPIDNGGQFKYFDSIFAFCHQSTVILSNGTAVTTKNCTKILMQQCLELDIDPKFFDKIGPSKMPYLSCVDPKQWRALMEVAYMDGIAISSSFGYLQILLTQCNPLLNNNCANASEIQSKLQSGFIQLLYSDRLMDQSRPGNPYQAVQRSILTAFSLNKTTFLKNYYRHSFFTSVENFYYYFPQESTYHVLTLVSEQESQVSFPGIFGYIDFFLDDRVEYYNRTYVTFFDILGNIGGFQTFLYFILGIIVFPLTKLSQTIQLVNEIFTFEDETTDLTKSSLFGRQSTLKMSTKSVVNQVFILRNQLGQQSTLKKLLDQKDRKLQLDFCDRFVIFCCGRKKQLLDKASTKIYTQIDIVNIVNKLIEIDKLKHLLLDKDQLILFDYISKPVISVAPAQSNRVIPLRRQFSQQAMQDKDLTLQSRMDRLLVSYKSIKASPQLLDQKLLTMMDDNLKSIFEEDNTGRNFQIDSPGNGNGDLLFVLKDDVENLESLQLSKLSPQREISTRRL